MPFPTVKSDPWRRRRPRRRRRRRGFWPPDAWDRLVKQAHKDYVELHIGSIGVISPNCLALIAEFDAYANAERD